MSTSYLHGYNAGEQERLCLQAGFLENMVHEHLDLSGISHLLEIGCGVGAQTILLLSKYPSLKITAIDREHFQIQKAKENLKAYPELEKRVRFVVADIHNFSPSEKFDGAFFCWVLEHVHSAKNVLSDTKKLLETGASIFITEVFHHSFYTYPESDSIARFWKAFADLQREMDGDPDVGIKLGSYLHDLGFHDINTYNIGQYWDKRNTKKRTIFLDYFKELAFTAQEKLLETKLIDLSLVERVQKGFEALKNNPNSILYYRGFQATAIA